MSLDRIEIALEKLTTISGELKTIIAVHEQRITIQERTSAEIHDILEKRREELDNKLKDAYDTMREQDNEIVNLIDTLRRESAEQHKNLTDKISKLEKFMWIAIGGGITASWVVSFILSSWKILH